MTRFTLPADHLEYEVLDAVWALRAASVRDLHEQVGVPEGRVYTTTAKVVDRLRAKGLVKRRRIAGTFVYSPTVERGVVERARARHLVTRLLGPRPRAAIAALVEAVDDVDPGLLDELERAVQAQRRSSHGT